MIILTDHEQSDEQLKV